jgi:hypothetical protein
VSTTVEPAPAPGLASTEPARWTKERGKWRPSRLLLEHLALFAVASSLYFALGLWIVLREHIVLFDGLSRLAHAYFVWWNVPPKLTAIGFVWPPMATVVFLPFTLIRPLATSLVALPLVSALFGGALLVMLNRLFVLCGMKRWQRYPLIVAFGINPMIAFYASNGMSEIVYLFLLVGGIDSFLRWYLTRSPGALIFAAMFFAFGILSRYEVFTWALVLPLSLVMISIRQRVSRSEVEGRLLTYLAPISYAAGLWFFFNWLILGSPFYFLKQQAPGAPTSPGQAPPPVQHTHLSPLQIADKIASLNWHLFPPTILVLAALAVVLYRRRDLMTATLIVMLVLNAAFTWLIIVGSGALAYLELRYNMRAMPIAIAAVGWIFLVTPRARRVWVWGAALAMLLAAIPATAQTMETFRYQYRESNFIHAVRTGQGLPDQLGDARRAARWIDEHVHTNDAVLTDDSQTFPAMLLSGRPGLFWDRIDRGDAQWLLARDDPWGRVRYFLYIPGGPDLIAAKYPALTRGANPGLTPVFRAGKYVVVRVAPHPPRIR